jgi:uncharacterized protein (DUF362 family)
LIGERGKKMAKVVLQDCSEYSIDLLTEKINTGVELLGGWDSFVSPGMKVLLKVNLIGPKAADTAAITDPTFVRALTRILKNLGCVVWIGDSSGGAIAGIAPTAQALSVSGLKKVADEEGAFIKNFDREGVIEVAIDDGHEEKMYLAKPMFDADVVINLPKLKTHSAQIYTGAVKNLFGCIPGLKKADYHRMAPDPKDFGMIIADIHKAVKVDLHIMDGVSAMQGEGPTAGQVYHAGKILRGRDPLAVDTVAAAMLGMEVEDVPILMSAREKQLGCSDLNEIEIVGDYDAPPRLGGFKLPTKFRSTKKRNQQVLVKLIDFLKTRPRINTKACKQCNMCVESCPVKAIERDTKIIDYNLCIECMCCHELCQFKAVELRKDNRLADVFMRIGLCFGKYR